MHKLSLFVKKHALRISLLLILFVSVILAVFAYLYRQAAPRSRAAGEDMTAILTATADTNGDYTIKLQVNPNTSFITQGYVMKLNFDKDALKLTATPNYILGVRASQANDSSDETLANGPNSTGTIVLVGEIQSSGQPLTQGTPVDVATFHFHPLNTTPSIITVVSSDFTDQQTSKFIQVQTDGTLTNVSVTGITIDVNNVAPTDAPTATDTPPPDVTPGDTATPEPPTPTPTITVQGSVILNIKVRLAGILSKPADQYNSLRMKVSLKHNDSQDPVTAMGDFTADDTGIWSGRVGFDVPAGTDYKVFVKGPKQLQKKFCVNNPTESAPGTYHCGLGAIAIQDGDNNLDFSGASIPSGDLPNDGVQDGLINSYDLSLVRNIFENSDSERRKPENLVIADLNLDGYIDAQDYSLIISALSTRTDEED